MTPNQTIAADKAIRSGSPDGSIRAHAGISRQERTGLFSGVRSSGQYCCPGLHATVAPQERLNPNIHQLGSAFGMRD
jgi:hypothetical protein